jgi:P-type E1-E2 ATPase
MRIGNFLIAIAAALAVVLIAVQLSRGVSILRLAEFVLILLVASVPVAMPAVLSMTMALGAKLLAREKAIVSRLESIEEMAGMEVLCSDKTGTLTQNRLTLGEISPGSRPIRRRCCSPPRSPPRRKTRIRSISRCSRVCAIVPRSPPSSPRPISRSTR